MVIVCVHRCTCQKCFGVFGNSDVLRFRRKRFWQFRRFWGLFWSFLQSRCFEVSEETVFDNSDVCEVSEENVSSSNNEPQRFHSFWNTDFIVFLYKCEVKFVVLCVSWEHIETWNMVDLKQCLPCHNAQGIHRFGSFLFGLLLKKSADCNALSFHDHQWPLIKNNICIVNDKLQLLQGGRRRMKRK